MNESTAAPAVLRKLAALGVEPDDLAEAFNLPALVVAEALSGDETQPPAETLAAVKERLRSAGWRPGPPPQLYKAAARIDRSVCRKVVCGHCQHRGLVYLAFHQRGRYVAVAACPACSSAEEF